VGLDTACSAIAKGDCTSAIVGGVNLIMTPDLLTRLSDQGMLSPDGSCKTFSAGADGYARAEAVVAVYVKSLSAAIRDGNPIRSVITGSATNFDGRTNPLTMPSAAAQEALIRRTYEVAGVDDFGKTALFECHGTGTAAGDPIEANAISAVFGEKGGVCLGSNKPNVGHSEGASGLTSVIKATLALEHKTIPPNIKCSPLNPKIPFEQSRLVVPMEATPWPEGRDERISINSFGVGGTNAHLIVESATSFLSPASPQGEPAEEEGVGESAELLVLSAATANSLKALTENYQGLIGHPESDMSMSNVAYTLAARREHLPHRCFAIASKKQFDLSPPTFSPPSSAPPSLVMVFTGQGAASPQMGRDLMLSNSTFSSTISRLDSYVSHVLGASWSLQEELLKSAEASRVYEAEFSQPLCTALQIALVDTLASFGIKPAAVVGHSSGEVAAAYAAGVLTAEESMAVAYHRGAVSKSANSSGWGLGSKLLGQKKQGGMAAVGISWSAVQAFLKPGVVVACDNAPESVTLSGDADKLEAVVKAIKDARPDVSVAVLRVEKAYHSHHMLPLGQAYHDAMVASGVVGSKPSAILFFSSVYGRMLDGDEVLGPDYWRENLESPVLFRGALTDIVQQKEGAFKSGPGGVFLEIGPHSALAGPVRQVLSSVEGASRKSFSYIPTLVRKQNSRESLLQTIGRLWTLHLPVDFSALVSPKSRRCLPDLPRYPWDHSRKFWLQSRVAKEWLGLKFPDHCLLGSRLPESTHLEPVWRNFLDVEKVTWLADHKVGENIVFPFAGYVSIAAEAARQVSGGIEDGVSLRHVSVSAAMMLEEETATEVNTTFRRHRLTENTNSEWWEFTVSSWNGHVWTRHCQGQVMAVSHPPTQQNTPAQEDQLPRKVNGLHWHKATHREGLHYGPTFSLMADIRTSTRAPHLATARMPNYQ